MNFLNKIETHFKDKMNLRPKKTKALKVAESFYYAMREIEKLANDPLAQESHMQSHYNLSMIAAIAEKALKSVERE